MRPLVRATAAFGVVLVTSLLMLGAEALADCKLVQQTPGGVTVGKKLEVWATCTGVDYPNTEFYWWVVDNQKNRISLGGGANMSRLKNIEYRKPGTYTIEMRYGNPAPNGGAGTWTDVTPLAMTAEAAPPPVARTKAPAPPAARVAFLDQVTFSPASFKLKPGERATATATKPNIGDPHIQWSIPGAKGTPIDKWTIAFTLRKPGNYTLDALVTDGSNSVNTRRYTLPIEVIGDTLAVRLQGHTKLQLNEGGGKVPVVVTPQNGVPPYRLTVSVAGGASGSRNFDRQTQFNILTTTPGSKTITIAVVDAKGSSFNRTIPFSIAAAAAPPPNSANPFKGSYEGVVTGPNPPNRYKYWAHVPNYDPDGTVYVALYAFGDNYHVTLKRGSLTVDTGSGFKTSGTGSISGNGAVGTTITMQWTQAGNDGKPTPYTWVLKKYDDQDYGGPQPGYAR